MSVMTAAERQIVQEALDSARFGFTTYAQAYLALQQILTDPLGPMGHRAGVSNSTFLFLGAAANVNAGIGIMASLGHAYSLEQLLLRTGSSQISQAMAQDVKAASDTIAQNVIESQLN